MEKELNTEALSAAIAGFLACHVLTCRFLVQEGVVDQARFTAYLETAMTEMAPGIEDLIVAAHADARRKADALLQEKMKAVTGGLPLPPGMKLF